MEVKVDRQSSSSHFPKRLRLAAKVHAVLCLLVGTILYVFDFASNADAGFRVNQFFETFLLVVVAEVFVRFVYAYCKEKERGEKGCPSCS